METTEIINPFDQYKNMSLEELEQAIITLWNGGDSEGLLDLDNCLFERKYRINRDHAITAQELAELKRVNRLITKHTFRVCAEVEELFEKLKTNALPNYNDVTVKAKLYPSGDLIKFEGDESSNYEAMDEILSDTVFGMPSKYLLEIDINCNRTTGEERTDYMCFYDEDARMWDNLFYFTFKKGEISEEDAFDVYHPMHALYDHSPYSRQDIIRISDFKSEITVTFE